MTGLLLCLPTVVLLASASLAMLIGELRRTLTRRLSDLPMTEPGREELRDDVNPLSPAPAGRLSAYIRGGTSWPDPDRVCARVPRRSGSRVARPQAGRRRLVPP
jgi:hypothetical protein